MSYRHKLQWWQRIVNVRKHVWYEHLKYRGELTMRVSTHKQNARHNVKTKVSAGNVCWHSNTNMRTFSKLEYRLNDDELYWLFKSLTRRYRPLRGTDPSIISRKLARVACASRLAPVVGHAPAVGPALGMVHVGRVAMGDFLLWGFEICRKGEGGQMGSRNLFSFWHMLAHGPHGCI